MFEWDNAKNKSNLEKHKLSFEDAQFAFSDPRQIIAIDSSEIIQDFLPRPEDLVFKKATVKVTMNLSKESVDFFRKRSRKYGVSYQKMINNLVDKYVERYRTGS